MAKVLPVPATLDDPVPGTQMSMFAHMVATNKHTGETIGGLGYPGGLLVQRLGRMRAAASS